MDPSGSLLSPAEERFERWRRNTGFVAGPVLFALVWLCPIPGLADPGHRMLAIMALVGTWWLSEALPLAATALMGPALCVLVGITPARDALRPFADPVIFLFLGGFLLAEAMVKHGLNRRVALAALSIPWVGRSPAGLMCGFGLLTAAISAWVSNTATAAMMMPIAISILRELAVQSGASADEWRRLPAATSLILVTAFAASIGGLATPIGTPPNIIGVGLVERMLDRRILFVEWMAFAIPAAVVLTAAVIWQGWRGVARRGEAGAALKTSPDWLRSEAARLGRWSRPQAQVAIVFLLAVLFWVLPGVAALVLGREAPLAVWMQARLPEGIVALLAAVALFVLRSGDGEGEGTLTWTDASRIDWGTILLFGGGMALGEQMFKTGLAEWLGAGLAGFLPSKTPFALAALFAAIGVIVSEATSNTASATMIIPLAIAVAQEAGVDPIQPALAACLGCSLGFMLPVSTPPNAIAYGTGAVPLLRMMRHGLWLDLVGCVVVVACVQLLVR